MPACLPSTSGSLDFGELLQNNVECARLLSLAKLVPVSLTDPMTEIDLSIDLDRLHVAPETAAQSSIPSAANLAVVEVPGSDDDLEPFEMEPEEYASEVGVPKSSAPCIPQ